MGDHHDDDCSVCLQPRMYPTQLPCGHVFCYLCLKGFIRSRKCALCRQGISSDYLSNPVLLKDASTSGVESTHAGGNNSSQWFYEGRNGWWKYDERSNAQLEEKLLSGVNEFQLLMAGTLYNIDFPSMLQIRLNDPAKRRQIKRAAPTLPNKGVAGINITINSRSTAP